MKGELKNLSLDYETKKPEITLTVDGNIEQLEKLKGQTLAVELKRYRRRRSLEANAYSWVLTQKIAEALGQSTAWVHNDMLRKYGQIELIDGKAVYIVLLDSETVESQINESEDYHLRPTSQVQPGKDGMYRTWMMIRGSHTYDTLEMSMFINGIIHEAKDLGIETESPQAIVEMMERYGKKFISN
ncbi:MAG: hypothetical protein LIP02_13785 [Bacteroidales bacterium]|nr:hypothetical protein [Bacteroidales bacterium]MCC8177377.1 hypothetical protein [Bacteroidales bacterium]